MLSKYNALKGVIKPPGHYNIFIIISPQALLGLYCPKASGLLFEVLSAVLTSASWFSMKSKAKRVQIMSLNTFLNLFWLNMSLYTFFYLTLGYCRAIFGLRYLNSKYSKSINRCHTVILKRRILQVVIQKSSLQVAQSRGNQKRLLHATIAAYEKKTQERSLHVMLLMSFVEVVLQ